MRYFFDLVNGDTCTDLGGAVYRSDEAARQEAILRSIDQRKTSLLQDHNGYSFIRVRDEEGRTVCRVQIDH